MNNFLSLVYNELIKTYVRKSTWIMYLILAGLVIGYGLLNYSLAEEEVINYHDQENWRELMEEENERLLREDQRFQQEFEEEEGLILYDGPNSHIIEKNNLYLEEDIQPEKYGTWQFTTDSAGLLSVVSLLTIIVAAGIVAHEFRWGTIKLLLIRPITRTKILAAKYVSVLFFALFTVIFLVTIAWVFGLLLYGWDSPTSHMIISNFALDRPYQLVQIYKELIANYGYNLVNLVMMTTLAFMISAIFRNSSLAIGIAVFLMMGGNMIVGIFYDKPFAKYILFAHTNLKQHIDGTAWIEGITLQFSIVVLIVYYVIFLFLSWIFFVKRDVAGT